jgi:hypothetical protein
MTTTTAVEPKPTATTTTEKPARQSRATRSAAKATAPKLTAKPKVTSKPKSTPKPKAEPQPKGPSTTALKQGVTQWSVDVLSAALAKNPPAGVDAGQAAEWLGSWLQYFPGVRQSKITWPGVFGAITMAGARQAGDDDDE